MFDTHFDLLTIAYRSYLTGDYSYIEKISKYFNDNNVRGVFANLYFMSKEEMENEICSNYYSDDVSVLDMFVKAKEVLDSFLPNTEIIYSIEGADYIKDSDELEKLYEAGLDSLILCWNTESKYASGNRSDKGLTDLGKKLISKAIDLGIGIDLSHANKNTFYDLCDLIEEKQKEGIKVYSFASHSNARSLCERTRNLDDRQLERIKEIGGLVGVFSNRNFVVNDPKDYDIADKRKEYIDHIEHVKNIVGEDNVILSTDDMEFCGWYDSEYYETSIYDYSTIACELFNDLVNRFGEDISANMMYNNVKNKIWCNIKNRRNYERSKS